MHISTIANYLRDVNNVIKLTKTDSVGEVEIKLAYIFDKFNNEYYLFTANLTVKTENWVEMVKILRTFLSSIPDTIPIMRDMMTAYTGN